MRVLFTKKFHQNDIEYLNERVDESVSFITPESFDVPGVVSAMKNADVLFGGMLHPEVMENGKHLKLIQIPWTGVDNLNFELLSQYETPICNSHSNARVVAEHTVAMVLGVACKLPYHDRMLRQNRWNRVSPEGNSLSPFSTNLFGSKVLYIGFGAIAKECAKLFAGFNMQVSVVNTTGQVPEDFSGAVNAYKVSDLVSAVVDQDVVIVAMPLTEDTRSLIDSNVTDAMKDTSILVNVSRGAIVSESALYNALKENSIGAAAIDTWYQAPSANSPEIAPSSTFDFSKFDNMLMSPHRAGYAVGGFPHLDDPIVNLNNLVHGRSLINVIDTKRRY